MNLSSVRLNHATPFTGPKWAHRSCTTLHFHRNTDVVSFVPRASAASAASAPSSLAVSVTESPSRIESLSQVSGVLGCQWGDEGKGKLVDILAQHFDIVARCQVSCFLSLHVYILIKNSFLEEKENLFF